MNRTGSIICLLVFFNSFHVLAQQPVVSVDRMELYLPLLSGKHVGVVANAASINGNGVNIVDHLLYSGVHVTRIYSPEHGFRNPRDAGEQVADSIDPATSLPVISLYGKKKKPSASDLAGIDIMVFDLQDVGVRFFTYLSTLAFVMDACAMNGIPLLVTDRPNPNGAYIDGPVLEPAFSSFVGLYPVPVVYGMTIGEYASMLNGEGWMESSRKCNLTVIPLANYNRHTGYELPRKPSPNLPTPNAVYLYPSLCLFEGTIVSVGRGTLFPFEVFGHPDMKGCSFLFMPESIAGMSKHPPFEGIVCHGVDLRDHFTGSLLPDRMNLSWLLMAFKNLGSNPAFFNDYFDKLAGNAALRQQIIQGKSEQQIRESWQPGIEKFKNIRKKYLLYPE